MTTYNRRGDPIKGVDISYCQNGIDYNKLQAAGVKFAIIRAGFSRSTDSTLTKHVRGCESAGIDYGFYWYSCARNTADAQQEAAACLNAIKKFAKPKYPVFFDGENDDIAAAVGKTEMTKIALAFADEIEGGGYPAGIYANPAWMETKYDKSRIIGNIDIWLACWTYDPETKPRYNYGQTMWQWGIEGYGMNVDADVCYVDYPTETAKWYANHPVEPKPAKTVEQLAEEVIKGLWGYGDERRKRLTDAGYDYDAVQAEVNRILREKQHEPDKSVHDIAVEVINGLWGNGEERKQKLTAAGYDYEAVQAEVDRLLK